jgi:hypothetical protein
MTSDSFPQNMSNFAKTTLKQILERICSPPFFWLPKWLNFALKNTLCVCVCVCVIFLVHLGDVALAAANIWDRNRFNIQRNKALKNYQTCQIST